MKEPEIRDSRPDDLAQVRAIYAHEVEHGTASFELTPPRLEAIARRREAVLDLGLPHLVAVLGDRVAGFAYAGRYRPRPAYASTAEISVYVADWARRRGVGQALLGALVTRCERTDVRQLVAIIGDSTHAASIALHAAAGFRHVGTLENVGYKLGRWLDSVIMQRSIGAGAGAAPAGVSSTHQEGTR